MLLEAGQMLSHYRLIDKIGEGGMGVVWRARDTKLTRDVALKFLPPQPDQERCRRFLREARTAAIINHPNIATVYEVGEAADTTFIAMELVVGTSLRSRIGQSPLPLEEALVIACQMADGLTHAHQAKVIHRDLKPDNVMIGADGHVRILDFGLAKLNEPREERSASKLSQASTITDEMTREGRVLGTPAYMSPEQARGTSVDARSDTFSFGSTLYEMVTGRPPFHGATPMDTLMAVLQAEPAPASSLNEEVPAELERILRKCLQKDRDERYQDTRDLLVDLRQLKRDTDSQPVPRVDSSGVTEDHSRSGVRPLGRLVAWSSAVVVLAALATMAALNLSRRSDTRPELTERRLTTNPAENPVDYARISPDGTYLAYVDQEGLFVRILDTGEVKRITPIGGTDEARPAGWFPDGTRLLVTVQPEGEAPSLWVTSILTGATQLLREQAWGHDVSPDGNYITFSPAPGDETVVWLGMREIWLMDSTGANPRRLVSPESDSEFIVWWARWSPDSGRIAYRRQSQTPEGHMNDIETCDLEGGSRTVVLSPRLHIAPGIHAVWVRDGRIIFSWADSRERPRDHNLWAIDVDASTGEARSEPRKLTSWTGFASFDLSATRDGRQIASVRFGGQTEIYVAEFREDGSGLAAPERFTMDIREDFPSAWMPDGESLLFSSGRRGTTDIFRRRIGGRDAEAVVTGPGEEFSGRVSPDGRWILYSTQRDRMGIPSTDPRSMMRVPASGGSPEEVFVYRSHFDSIRCGSRPGSRCVVAEMPLEPDKKTFRNQITFWELDPVKGKGELLAQVDGSGSWELSPDGRRIVWHYVSEGDWVRLGILTLDGEERQELVLEGQEQIGPPSWCATGDCLYAVSQQEGKAVLLRIDLEGRTEVIPQAGESIPLTSGLLLSPDGRRVAFAKRLEESSVWLIEGF